MHGLCVCVCVCVCAGMYCISLHEIRTKETVPRIWKLRFLKNSCFWKLRMQDFILSIEEYPIATIWLWRFTRWWRRLKKKNWWLYVYGFQAWVRSDQIREACEKSRAALDDLIKPISSPTDPTGDHQIRKVAKVENLFFIDTSDGKITFSSTLLQSEDSMEYGHKKVERAWEWGSKDVMLDLGNATIETMDGLPQGFGQSH